MTLTHLNPDHLTGSPVFSQGVLSTRTGLVYVGGQNGTDSAGTLREGFAAQTEQAYRNVLAVLEAAGCSTEDGTDARIGDIQSVVFPHHREGCAPMRASAPDPAEKPTPWNAQLAPSGSHPPANQRPLSSQQPCNQ